MESLNSKHTSHNVVESFDKPEATEDPKVTAEETEEEKEKKDLDKLFNESVAMYKTAMVETIKNIRKGDGVDES
jgi:hypothetical protein